MSSRERVQAILEQAVLLPHRLRHSRRYRQRYRARQSAIATTEKTLGHAVRVGARDTATVLNVGLYVLLVDQDLADFTDQMIRARGNRGRNFVARHFAVLLYEASEDLTQLFGKDFRSAADRLGADADLKKRLNLTASGLHSFRKTHGEHLKEIRVGLAAHRERDTLAYLGQVRTLEPLDIMRLGAEFTKALSPAVEVLTDIAALARGLPAVMNDVLRSKGSSRP